MKEIVTTAAPQAIGPYSQATRQGNLLFVSGQLPIVPETGEFISDDISEQVRQCLRNIRAIAQAAGCDLSACLKTVVLVTDLKQFASVNEAYGEYFVAPFPARATFEVSALPKNAKVEIEAIISLD